MSVADSSRSKVLNRLIAVLIIDRAAEGDNIVHFLNQVDEADLLSLIEQEEQAPPACS